MRILTARWVAGCIAAGSIALMAGALVLEYVDRDLLPASMTGWTFGNVSGQVVNLAVPVVGFVLASRRPANRIGWLFLTAGLVLALECLRRPVRAARPGRGAGVLARGPGVRLVLQLAHG